MNGLEMIARMWKGRVPSSKANAYREFVNTRTIPNYQSLEGNVSIHRLEQPDGDSTTFITFSFWESLNVIREFIGDDINVAKYYPEDQNFLLEFEPTILHDDVVGRSQE
ncbi:MAG: antibiotic biosynthesis monooxygenase [Cyanobacteria bacterium J06633_2]